MKMRMKRVPPALVSWFRRMSFAGVAAALLAAGSSLAADPHQEGGSEPGSWQQILRSEKPMPMPVEPVPRASVPADFSMGVEKDMDSGEVTEVQLDVARAAFQPFGRVEGFEGNQPEPDSGPSFEVDGDFGAQPMITPTPPQPITQTLDSPFRTVYKLRMRFGNSRLVCSASPFGAYHLITAGHCVFNHDTSQGVPRGWADEIWAFPAQTDLVLPNDEPDHPFGEARITHMRGWACWTQDQNWDCDLALLTLDRRLPERTGWMGREWGNQASSLNFSGYPTEVPYVPQSEILQYPGFDSGNVSAYFDRRIRLDAFIYGGHSGGPVWRYNASASARYIQGVNSTSTRTGTAHATRYRSNEETYYGDSVTTDDGVRPPLARPDLKEETYYYNALHKTLRTTNVGRRGMLDFRYNVFNAGFADSGPITVRYYLSGSTNITSSGRLIGTATHSSLGPNTYAYYDKQLRLPPEIGAGQYYLGWTMASANAEYPGMDYCYGAARPGCNNYGVMGQRLTVRADSDYNWTITASAGTGGSITPSGSVTIEDGLRQIFTLSASSGYQLTGVTGTCGGTMMDANRFQTSPVTANCTVRATFGESDSIFKNGFD